METLFQIHLRQPLQSWVLTIYDARGIHPIYSAEYPLVPYALLGAVELLLEGGGADQLPIPSAENKRVYLDETSPDTGFFVLRLIGDQEGINVSHYGDSVAQILGVDDGLLAKAFGLNWRSVGFVPWAVFRQISTWYSSEGELQDFPRFIFDDEREALNRHITELDTTVKDMGGLDIFSWLEEWGEG